MSSTQCGTGTEQVPDISASVVKAQLFFSLDALWALKQTTAQWRYRGAQGATSSEVYAASLVSCPTAQQYADEGNWTEQDAESALAEGTRRGMFRMLRSCVDGVDRFLLNREMVALNPRNAEWTVASAVSVPTHAYVTSTSAADFTAAWSVKGEATNNVKCFLGESVTMSRTSTPNCLKCSVPPASFQSPYPIGNQPSVQSDILNFTAPASCTINNVPLPPSTC